MMSKVDLLYCFLTVFTIFILANEFLIPLYRFRKMAKTIFFEYVNLQIAIELFNSRLNISFISDQKVISDYHQKKAILVDRAYFIQDEIRKALCYYNEYPFFNAFRILVNDRNTLDDFLLNMNKLIWEMRCM